jgi:TIR domain
MSNPKVFISYSHDSSVHKEWVLKLAIDLRANGVDADLDQWQQIGSDLAAFMHQGIATSDRVLMVCTDQYVQKAENGTGGVGYEKMIVTGEMVKSIDTIKFVPVCRNSSIEHPIPNFLGARLYVDFGDNQIYQTQLLHLIGELYGRPQNSKPPLGTISFTTSIPTQIGLIETVNASGISESGRSLLESEWFENQAKVALKKSAELEVAGHMELRFSLLEPTRKSQIELLNAVRTSTVPTFGWPIPILLENREEFRPYPLKDGIKAEVAIKEDMGRFSFDYWAASNSGQFYMLQSLFEDSRKQGEIFFNTRIVRVTESIMFAYEFFDNLGVAHDSVVALRIGHGGLKGRKLSSSSNRRLSLESVTEEENSHTEVIVTITELKSQLADNVRKLLSPLFLLFNFQEFGPAIYSDIVSKFEAGQVT